MKTHMATQEIVDRRPCVPSPRFVCRIAHETSHQNVLMTGLVVRAMADCPFEANRVARAQHAPAMSSMGAPCQHVLALARHQRLRQGWTRLRQIALGGGVLGGGVLGGGVGSGGGCAVGCIGDGCVGGYVGAGRGRGCVGVGRGGCGGDSRVGVGSVGCGGGIVGDSSASASSASVASGGMAGPAETTAGAPAGAAAGAAGAAGAAAAGAASGAKVEQKKETTKQRRDDQ